MLTRRARLNAGRRLAAGRASGIGACALPKQRACSTPCDTLAAAPPGVSLATRLPIRPRPPRYPSDGFKADELGPPSGSRSGRGPREHPVLRAASAPRVGRRVAGAQARRGARDSCAARHIMLRQSARWRPSICGPSSLSPRPRRAPFQLLTSFSAERWRHRSSAPYTDATRAVFRGAVLWDPPCRLRNASLAAPLVTLVR